MKKSSDRHVYLNLKTLDEAREIFLARFRGRTTTGEETVPTPEALDRVTAAPIFARLSSPGYHSAAMDGVALRAEDTYGAGPDQPRDLAVGQNAFFVNTGQILPEGTNAVVMIEQVQELDPGTVRIEASAYPYQHVRKVGEDIVATEMVAAQGRKLGPYELGALAAAGVLEVPVRPRPRVAVIPTGSELVSFADLGAGAPAAGRIVEFNSIILSGLIRRAGGDPTLFPVAPDEPGRIQEAISQAAKGDFDLVIMNAGSSAGGADYTADAIAALGEVLVHGITIMPGKPTILGVVNDKPVIGNPGYPVSAVISFEQLAAPLLYSLVGLPTPEQPRLRVAPTQAIPSRLGLEEFIRVKLGRLGDRVVAVPLPRGAGSITTLTRADGMIRIPANKEGVAALEEVDAELIRPASEIEGALIAIGSHDNTLDLLADLLHRRNPRFSLSSGNVGSLGGLLTMKRGFCHLAGSHLLDTTTGEYNISYLKKHLAGLPLRLVHLVMRDQGFIVLPGNPKNIVGFKDLARPGVRYVNRQAGAGTRILLDYHLKSDGIQPDQVLGYDYEETTHMAVAVAVLSGRADAGLAVYSAAKALDLDFVPVTTEEYDLVIPEAYWSDPRIQTLMDVIRSNDFIRAARALGGYGTDRTGQVLWTWDGQGDGEAGA